MQPAGEQEVLGLQLGLLDPRLQGVPGGPGALELDRALGLVLHNDGTRRQLFAMTHIADLEGDEVAAGKLAVDAQVEECQLTHQVLHLKPNPQRPDVLGLERGLLADDLALVPWLVIICVGNRTQDGLPSS